MPPGFWHMRCTLEQVAKEVHMTWQRLFGSTGVVALVALAAACGQTDTSITTAVKARLASDHTIQAARISVNTKGKVVTLEGGVQSQSEKEQVLQLARSVEGVREVKDALTVLPSQQQVGTTGWATEQRKTGDIALEPGRTLANARITATIRTKMMADRTVSPRTINIDTVNGVVVLRGTVKTDAEKKRAVDIAKGTEGVRSVTDQLEVAAR
jgi:hyperosmotically inducible protein